MTTKLKICQVCKAYTLKNTHCNKPTLNAHYKFIKVTVKPNNN